MKKVVLYLIGYPGTGKLTIAKEVCKQTEDFILIDNHRINNLFFSVIGTDGFKKIPEEVFDRIGDVREMIFEIIQKYGPADNSYIFTNFLADDGEEDLAYYNETKQFAENIDAAFVPVVLEIDKASHAQRFSTKDRKLNLKWIDPKGVKVVRERSLLRFAHANKFVIDVSNLSPEASASKIINHINSVTS